MGGQMRNLNEILIDEFYKIFSESTEGIYAGSRDQIRVTMQLKMGRFIPLVYIDRVLKAFISSKLVIKSNKTKDIERQIGSRYYKLTAQIIYFINEHIEDKEKILDSLKITFSDFKDKSSDIVLESDLKKLRILEDKKSIKLKDLLERKTYPYSFSFTDIEFLYDIPRSKILEYIYILEQYNSMVVEEERKRALSLAEKEKLARQEWFNKIYDKQVNIIENTLELEGIIEIELRKREIYYQRESNIIGIFKIDNIIFEDDKLILTDNNNYKIMIDINSFRMSYEEFTVSLIDDNLEYIFTINKSLDEDMEFLSYLYEKANNYKQM